MKHLFLALIAVTTISFAANAQGGFRLGIKGGANLNQVEGASLNDGFAFSYHLGGFAEIDFTKKFGIQPEVLWNQSKTTYGTGLSNIYQPLLNPTSGNDITLNYLSIPILLRYNIGSMLSLNAGPQFGILLNKDKNLLQNGEQAFASGDFGMVAGLQVNLKTLRLYGRYNIGLKNINDIDQKEKWTNQQLQFGIGLRL
jgi:Outer membrane protein beta-barrel domain